MILKGRHCVPEHTRQRNIKILWCFDQTHGCSVIFWNISFLCFSVQVAGGGGGSHGTIEIFSLNRPMPRAVKSLQVDGAVRCLQYVPGPSKAEEMESGAHKAASGTGTTICVGLDDGR